MHGELGTTMARKRYGIVKTYATCLLVGFLAGILLSNYCKNKFFSRCGLPDICCEEIGLSTSNSPDDNAAKTSDGQQNENPTNNFVFVGIMTAKKFIDSRGLAAHRTWVNTINGEVRFFSSEGSISKHGVPVVALPNVDDSYPPQKKSFMMLKYMHDHFLDQYEWFVRADDDVFVKGDKLDKFLRSINSSKPQFIGQAGVGKPEELGLLSLTATENFCMGGPGMIFSRETLRRMAPYVSNCLQNLYTTHEDVEIGRCVRKYAGIQCTWAYEMQQILYQNYKEDKGSFKKTLKSKEVEKAVTLHPVKDPVYQYRIYNHIQSTIIMNLHQKELRLVREVTMMEQLLGLQKSNIVDNKLGILPSLNKYPPKSEEEVLTWDFLKKPIYSHNHLNPKRGMEASLSGALDDVVMQVMQLVNKNARQRGRTIDFKEILYGYRRTNPLFGADYILDLLLIYRKHKGRKMTVPVRRHAYLQQSFMNVLFTEEIPKYHPRPSVGGQVINLFRQIAGGSDDQKALDKRKETIHFIMPLAGRLKIFQRFMRNIEDVCFKSGENVRLHVVLFNSEKEDMALERSIDLLQKYQRNYGGNNIEIIQANGAFNRGRGLELGASKCKSDALLYFIDVDIVLRKDALNRIRLNTKQGFQVYFPIVFSQFDPTTVCQDDSQHCACPSPNNCLIKPYDFHHDTGYWRQFGFGIAAMYRSDMLSVGGFDLSIEGWGKEDVDLYTKFIESNITVFRSIDPGMTHAFHPIECDASLETNQMTMCINSKAQSYGSVWQMAETVYNEDDIMRRHEKHSLDVRS
ncbi:chondroitin sulfate synthase 1-like isoform X1 [Haliotis rubra]|uniref:chondroitin sulfate synthase 1-like isoform X1 n=1 Tax=Haliotis rubra TaxID=36100 RepID=UPI001EE4EE8C|nr:chondroitin sulfate synthase 1-like isoform X1 [Haliotis rubra]